MNHVYVIVSVTEFGSHLVAAFDNSEVANEYAKRHNVPGWFIKKIKYYQEVE